MSPASATPLTSTGDAALTPRGSAPDRVPGLRERSKAKRRALIQRTAVRLFAERGFEHTTLADIAEEAEVAVRTVTGYFPSKLNLATSFMDEIAARLTAGLSAAPDADLVEALGSWLAEEEQHFDPELMELVDAMHTANPGLLALGQARFAEAGSVGRAAIRAEVGRPADDPTMVLCIAAVEAVIAAHFTAFTTHEPTPERHDAVIAYLHAVIDAAKPSA
jgi:AcrR family transcriptional regulator